MKKKIKIMVIMAVLLVCMILPFTSGEIYLVENFNTDYADCLSHPDILAGSGDFLSCSIQNGVLDASMNSYEMYLNFSSSMSAYDAQHTNYTLSYKINSLDINFNGDSYTGFSFVPQGTGYYYPSVTHYKRYDNWIRFGQLGDTAFIDPMDTFPTRIDIFHNATDGKYYYYQDGNLLGSKSRISATSDINRLSFKYSTYQYDNEVGTFALDYVYFQEGYHVNAGELSEDTACNDGLDNDNDGYVDYPDDPSCDSQFDDSEHPKDGSTCDYEVCSESDFCIAYTSFYCKDPIEHHGWSISPEDVEGFIDVTEFSSDNVVDLGEYIGYSFINDSGELEYVDQIQYDYDFTSNSVSYPLIVHEVDFYFDYLIFDGDNPDVVLSLMNTDTEMLEVRLIPSTYSDGEVQVGVYSQGQYLGTSTITSNDNYYFPVKIMFDTESEKFSVAWNDMGEGERSVDITTSASYSSTDSLKLLVGDEVNSPVVYYEQDFSVDSADCSEYSDISIVDAPHTGQPRTSECSVSDGSLHLMLENMEARFLYNQAIPNDVVENGDYTISYRMRVSEMIPEFDSTYDNSILMYGASETTAATTHYIKFERMHDFYDIDLRSSTSPDQIGVDGVDTEKYYDIDIFHNGADDTYQFFVDGEPWFTGSSNDVTYGEAMFILRHGFNPNNWERLYARLSIDHISVTKGNNVGAGVVTNNPETKLYLSKLNVYGSDPNLESYCDSWAEPYLLKESFYGYLSQCDWVAVPDSYANGNLRFFDEDMAASYTKLLDAKTSDEISHFTLKFDTKPISVTSEAFYSVSALDENYRGFIRLLVSDSNKLYYVSDGNAVEVAELTTNQMATIKAHVDFAKRNYDIYVDGVKVKEDAPFVNTDWVIDDVSGVRLYSSYSDAVIDNLEVYISDSGDKAVDSGVSDNVKPVDEDISVCGLFHKENPACVDDTDCKTGACVNGKCSGFDMNYCDDNGHTRGSYCMMAGMTSCGLNNAKDLILDNFVLFLIFIILMIMLGYGIYIFRAPR